MASEQRSEDWSGARVGPYLLGELLGTGACGAVYRARHVHLGRAAAVKILWRETAHERNVVERFIDEARTLGRLRHPGLVSILDCGFVRDESAYLAMELLHGEPLSERIAREAPLPLAACIDVARQLTAVLEVVHAAGVVHRDLKPANIFLVPDEGGERVKLLDFGVAKLLDGRRATAPGLLLGTPFYMAPEQCRGEPTVDARADIYALGAVLFEMATGEAPFARATVAEVIEAHLFAPPPRPSRVREGLPPLFDELIAIALAKHAGDRFADVGAFARALAPLAEDAPHRRAPTEPMGVARAVAEPLPPPVREAAPRRRWVRPLALALVSALAVAVALLALSRLTAPPRSAPTPLPVPAPRAVEQTPAVEPAPPSVEPALRAVEFAPRAVERPRAVEPAPRAVEPAPPPPQRRELRAPAPVETPPVSRRTLDELRDPFDDAATGSR